VKLELWESVMVITIFGLPLTYAYATLRQSVAGNSTFRGIVFCNLGTSKTVISNFVTSRQIETPYISPYGYPNGVPGGQKMVEETKNDEHTNVLIPWYPVSYLTIASSVFFFWGAYGSLPDAAIWWCLRTGGWGRSN
jgi:short subunit fatty acids transporter